MPTAFMACKARLGEALKPKVGEGFGRTSITVASGLLDLNEKVAQVKKVCINRAKGWLIKSAIRKICRPQARLIRYRQK